MEEIRPGRTGNEILRAVLARMKAKGIDGTMYSHPIGLNGHGAGPLIGLWDYQDGVVGRGEATVIPSMWFSIELQATTPVPEWGGQPVQMAQEEDMIVGADGKNRWARQRRRESAVPGPRRAVAGANRDRTQARRARGAKYFSACFAGSAFSMRDLAGPLRAGSAVCGALSEAHRRMVTARPCRP